jgi:hypothetical protein
MKQPDKQNACSNCKSILKCTKLIKEYNKYHCKEMLIETWVSYSRCKQKMSSFRGQANSTKMTSPMGTLTVPVCHLNNELTQTDTKITEMWTSN